MFSAIAWVMTLGIIPGVLYIPFLMKRIQGGLSRLKSRDEAWSAIFMDALFLGMISAFLGMIFKDIRSGLSWLDSGVCDACVRPSACALRPHHEEI